MTKVTDRHALYVTLLSMLHYVANEARLLLRKKKLTYALFAAALAAGSLYAASLRPVAATHDPSPSDRHPLTVTTPPRTSDAISQDNSTVAEDTGGSAELPQSHSASQQSNASVTVNGRDVAVPNNGSTRTVIRDKNGTTSVDVSHSSSGDGESSSSLSVQVNSSSSSSGGM